MRVSRTDNLSTKTVLPTSKKKTYTRKVGRPKGSLNVLSRKIAEDAAKEGITPLELKLRLMRHFWTKATDKTGNITNEKYALAAADEGDKLMPFMHARFASIQHTGPNGGPIPLDGTLKIIFVDGDREETEE